MNIFNFELNFRELFSWSKKKECVLVVDDDPLTVDLIRAAAEAEGYEVVAASTAEEARGILHANGRKFVVAMVDVRLPGMSGWQLRRQLMSFWPKLKTLVMSSSPESFVNMPQGETLTVLIKGASYSEFFRGL